MNPLKSICRWVHPDEHAECQRCRDEYNRPTILSEWFVMEHPLHPWSVMRCLNCGWISPWRNHVHYREEIGDEPPTPTAAFN